MANQTNSLPRPDLDSYRESLSLPWPRIVETPVEIIGRKLTTYISSAKHRDG